jgi:cell division protein FtsB
MPPAMPAAPPSSISPDLAVRVLALVFAGLIAALQFPMWLGKEANAKLRLRNEALEADVRDLKTGNEAIEERARAGLGMVRADEVFFQLQPAGSRGKAAPIQQAQVAK